MRIHKAVCEFVCVAMLIGVVTLSGVDRAQANVASDTAMALANNPDGGQNLELAIGEILAGYQGQPRIIVRELLQAAASATDEQMVAIGRALAAEVRALAATDPGESRAVAAVVAASRNAGLVRNFEAAGGPRPPALVIPIGGGGGAGGGGFDATSPN